MPQSTTSQLLGLCCYYLFAGICAFAQVATVAGTIIYPKTFGLFFTLPYYSMMFILGYELKEGLQWPWFSKDFWCIRKMREFLQIKMEGLPKDASGSQYMYAVFPHGSFCDYRFVMDGMLLEQGVSVKTLAATALFRMPLVREMSLWTSCVDARKSVATNVLKKGHSMMVLPGGEAEQIRTEFGKETIYLRKRKGFIKLAIRHSVPVVPVYVFGCSDYYKTSNFLFGPRLWLTKNVGVCIPFAFGWGPLCPRPVPTTIVFGEPISFKQNDDPSNEEVTNGHEEFMKQTKELFDKEKTKYGYGHRELEII